MQEIPIVLIGHKDHGKSTLIGRLLLDTKSVKETRVREVQDVDASFGQAFELAHLVDSFREEREREMTMDTTRALLKGKDRNYQLIDVPGHVELISNMLTGASAAQAALLMVSLKEGIEEQTRQHLEIAKLLGIEQVGVVLNKMDCVGYQEQAFEKTRERINGFLKEIGYKAEDIHFFPVSAREGDNVVEKSEKMPWYKGQTVMEFLEKEIKISEGSKGSLFLVQDTYGDLPIGRVESGSIKIGDELRAFPSEQKVKIRAIRDSEGDLQEAFSGQNVGLEFEQNLDVFRGTVLASADFNKKEGSILSGEMFWISPPSGNSLVLECGTAKVEADLKEPKSVNQWTKTPYSISLVKEIAFEPKGRTILGKIVLKDKGKIIAVGNIS
jgi:sulfate adenylyltransferase subunit 1 (EFTu-like GTPase family)